jgi:hypothetical protein
MQIEVMNVHGWGTNYHKSLDKYSNEHSKYNLLNLLFEKELNTNFSLKSGFYINSLHATWGSTYVDHFGGAISISESPREFSITNLYIPALLALNLRDPEGKLFLNFNAGPFLSKSLSGNSGAAYPVFDYLYTANYGYNLSAGIGSKKWQISFYLFKGLRNLARQSNPEVLAKAESDFYGLALTRIIPLAKKESEPQGTK